MTERSIHLRILRLYDKESERKKVLKYLESTAREVEGLRWPGQFSESRALLLAAS
jgi:hypothetical protein